MQRRRLILIVVMEKNRLTITLQPIFSEETNQSDRLQRNTYQYIYIYITIYKFKYIDICVYVYQ